KGLETISTPPINEQRVGSDLNSDGKLSIVNHITKQPHYVGDATSPLAYQLYPEGTEFLHTVRYIGVDSNGTI
ncbi:hypothetical protein CWC05_23210, partial [Pseudoalteromonas ruthenica]